MNLSATFLRITASLTMLIFHGYPKLINFSAYATSFPDPLGVGSATSLALVIFAEFFCSILIILGAATRLACIPLIFTMMIAFFVIHGSDPFSVKELAFLYLLTFIAIFISGSGSFSLKLSRLFTNNKILSFLSD